MARVGAYMTGEERLRRIEDILLKGVYLWADAVEDASAHDCRAVGGDPCVTDDQPRRATPAHGARRACGGADRPEGVGQRRRQRWERSAQSPLRSGSDATG